MRLVAGIVAFLLTALYTVVAQINIEGAATTADFTMSSYNPTLPLWLVVLAMMIPAVVFSLMVGLGYRNGGSLSKDEMRQSVAGTFVVGASEIVIILLGIGHSFTPTAIAAYLTIVGMVATYYLAKKAEIVFGGDE